jgi:WD40 repeat protein
MAGGCMEAKPVKRLLIFLTCLMIGAPVYAQDGARLQPDAYLPITAENIARMERAASLGRGQILDAFLEDDGAALTIISTRGILRFNALDLSAAPDFVPFEGDPFIDRVFPTFVTPNVTYSADRRTVCFNWTFRDEVIGGAFDLRTGRTADASSAAITFPPSSGSPALAQLIDPASGAVLNTFEFGDGRIAAAALSPDGALAALYGAVRGADGALQLWDAVSGEKIAEISAARDFSAQLTFADDGAQLMVTTDSAAAYYSIPDLSLIEAQPYALYTRSADSSTAAFVDGARALTVQSLADGSTRPTALTGIEPREVVKLMLSPDGSRLYMVTRRGGAVYAVDTHSGELLPGAGGFNTRIDALAFSADGARLLTSEADDFLPYAYARFSPASAVRVRDLRLDQADQVSGALANITPRAAAVSPSGSIAFFDFLARTLHLRGGDQSYTYADDNYLFVQQLAFSPDGALLAAYSYADVLIFDERLRLLARRAISAAPPTLRSQPLAWDGAVLIAADGNAVRFFSTPQLTEISALDQGARIQSIAFNPQTRTLGVIAGEFPVDLELRLWDMSGAQPTLRLTIETAGAVTPMALAFSPDGSLAAAGFDSYGDAGDQALAVIYDARTGAPLYQLRDCGLPFAFSPDGRLFACTSPSFIRLYAVSA